MVTYTCNPNYWSEIKRTVVGGQHKKNIMRHQTPLPSLQNELNTVPHGCYLSYMGGTGGRLFSEALPGEKTRSYLKNNQEQKKGLGHGSSGRTPVRCEVLRSNSSTTKTIMYMFIFFIL
jgi:hypothetical protein